MAQKPTYEELEQHVRKLEKALEEQKQMQKAFQDSERRFRDLIEGSIQGILIHRNHKPLFVNQKWADIHGYSLKEILRMETVVSLISQADQKRMLEYKEARLRKEYAPDEYEYKGVHKDGSFIWLDNRVRNVNWEGTEAIQTTIFDITKRKQAENVKEQLISELKKAIREIKTLHGLLPVCSHCKKVRDDKGYWNQIDAYIQEHSEAEVSHSICPVCAEKYYPEMNLYDDE
jgi:PAS domain S-box-containing protein